MKRIILVLLSIIIAGLAQPHEFAWAQQEPEALITCAFGYVADDTVPLNYRDIHLAGAQVSFSSADDGIAGPFPVGFPVSFFENTVTAFFVSTNGFIAFGDMPPASPTNARIPADFAPNNFMAPFWDDLLVGGGINDGKVFYKTFGAEPDRYLVVEWYQVARYGFPTDTITFEIVLHENGDIFFNYAAMNAYLDESTTGIEESDGVDGIEYRYNAAGIQSNMAIKFTFPNPGPRLKMTPLRRGQFFTNGAASFNLELLNTGTETETFDLQIAPVAGAAFGRAAFFDGVGAALVDTNGDGVADTGPLDPYLRVLIRIDVTQAGGVAVGDFTHLELTGRASSQHGKTFTAYLSAAVPAPFAQALTGPADGIKIQFVTPDDNFERQVFNFFTGRSLTVAEAATHLYLYAWEHQFIKYIPGPPPVFLSYANIEYTLVSTLTSLPMTIRVVEDNAEASEEFSVKDRSPVFLLAPRTGRIGSLFIQEEVNSQLEIRANVWFTVLDALGNPVDELPPRRVTDNSGWFKQGGLPGAPYYSAPSLAVIKDGSSQDKDLFVLIWEQRTMVDFTSDINDIWMAVYDEDGSPVLGPTKLTGSTFNGDRFYRPVVAPSAGDQFLLAYTTLNHLTQTYEITYAFFDRTGSVVVPAQPFPGSSGGGLDAVRLSDNRLLLAWTNYDTLRISYAVLDSTAGIVQAPSDLESPDLRGMNYVSVTTHTDLAGVAYGILTWGDDDWSQFLYYALVDQDGNLLTPPMAFRRGSDPEDPVIFSSYTGGGNDRLVYPIPWGIFLPTIRMNN